MGKFPHSNLHSIFSDWHYKKCKSTAYLCDIDRIWVELRESKPKAVFDLKTERDTLSVAGKILGEWFESLNIPFYIVQIRVVGYEQKQFTVYRQKTDTLITLKETEMIQWINNDLPPLETLVMSS